MIEAIGLPEFDDDVEPSRRKPAKETPARIVR